MLQPTNPYDSVWTAADLLERFGPIPLSRIRQYPAPGTATEEDLIDLALRDERLYELIDGTLLEKTMGNYEAMLAMILVRLIYNWVYDHDLGIIMGPDTRQRTDEDQIRMPDVAFYAWHQFPNRVVPNSSFLEVAADLAIEVISPGNTMKEMDTKLTEYFTAGSRLVWYVYPLKREVHVFTSPDGCTIVKEHETLTGGDVLPGFELSLAELFAQLGEEEESQANGE